jgi:hypothetical protein
MLRSVEQVLRDEARARDEAWTRLRTELALDATDPELATLILDDSAAHLWRTVDAALDRSTCPECSAPLGAGRRGCGACDLADGSRFVGQEPDRPGVPGGNEHAIRVAVTVVRHPHRWPTMAVTGNQLFLPLLAGGQLPNRREQLAVVDAIEAGRTIDPTGVTTFAELAARAHTAT